jgi:thiamine biosynthesis lipoprotein
LPVRTDVAMGTLVTIQVPRCGGEAAEALDRAFRWFHEVESRCTRFDQESELMQLTAKVGVGVPASAILYEALRFALMAAEASGGALDPTVAHSADDVSYRDVVLEPEPRTITLRRPLTLDLGAVAKGLAVDMAARELTALRDFAIDAGGDLYLGGSNEHGAPWRVGIRHPRNDGELIGSLLVSNQAVCTSGDYERPGHILDPRTGASPEGVASVTVIAPSAMLADALATAAFVLGPEDGIALLESQGVEGLIVTAGLRRHKTGGLRDVA